jgi:hypothetical protein
MTFSKLKTFLQSYLQKMNKSIVIFIFLLFLVPTISAQSIFTGSATKCFPDYTCETWGGCINGLQSRACTDERCGRREIIERRFCDKPGCTPKIECLRWSECIYTEKIENLIQGKVGFGGYHNRICRDANNCVDSFLEERPCEEFFPLELDTVNECDENFLVALDPTSKRRLAKISLDSWDNNKLEVSFTQGEKEYCSGCYNGILDGRELKVDCGGDCQDCVENRTFPSSLAKYAFWIFSALFSLLFFREIIYIKHQDSQLLKRMTTKVQKLK